VIDNGLRNAVSFRTSADSGRLLENIVFLELKRRGNEVWYFRAGNDQETDFLINPSDPILIQVCYSLHEPQIRKREISSLISCMRELGTDKGMILTKSDEETIEEGNYFIPVKPAWKYTLE
jgi:predicted AAA+ superfamily ATPase